MLLGWRLGALCFALSSQRLPPRTPQCDGLIAWVLAYIFVRKGCPSFTISDGSVVRNVSAVLEALSPDEAEQGGDVRTGILQDQQAQAARDCCLLSCSLLLTKCGALEQCAALN